MSVKVINLIGHDLLDKPDQAEALINEYEAEGHTLRQISHSLSNGMMSILLIFDIGP